MMYVVVDIDSRDEICGILFDLQHTLICGHILTFRIPSAVTYFQSQTI